MPAILGGALAPTATLLYTQHQHLLIPRANMAFIHVTSGKAGDELN